MTADAQIYARHKATPHMAPEVLAYYAGKNAVWAAIADGASKVANPFSDTALRAGFARGVRHANAEERLNLDAEWD